MAETGQAKGLGVVVLETGVLTADGHGGKKLIPAIRLFLTGWETGDGSCKTCTNKKGFSTCNSWYLLQKECCNNQVLKCTTLREACTHARKLGVFLECHRPGRQPAQEEANAQTWSTADCQSYYGCWMFCALAGRYEQSRELRCCFMSYLLQQESLQCKEKSAFASAGIQGFMGVFEWNCGDYA